MRAGLASGKTRGVGLYDAPNLASALMAQPAPCKPSCKNVLHKAERPHQRRNAMRSRGGLQSPPPQLNLDELLKEWQADVDFDKL